MLLCPVCLDTETALAARMAASSSAKKGKLFNVDDKVKSKKYNHSFVKDVQGKGKKFDLLRLCYCNHRWMLHGNVFLHICISVCNTLTCKSLDLESSFLVRFIYHCHQVKFKVQEEKCVCVSQAFAVWNRWILPVGKICAQCGVDSDSVGWWWPT